MIKEKLSNGNARFNNGQTLVEVSLSDLNALIDMTYNFEKRWELLKLIANDRKEQVDRLPGNSQVVVGRRIEVEALQKNIEKIENNY